MIMKHKIVFVVFCVLISSFHIVQSLFAGGSDVKELYLRTDMLTDPLFGIDYRPSEIHFDAAPKEICGCVNIGERCRELFLFGKTIKNNISFYYVYGWEEVESQDGIRHFEAESDSGVIVVISSTGCRDIGAGYAWSTQENERQLASNYGISDEVAGALLEDALGREVKAFGGRSNFLRKLKENNVDEQNLPMLLRAKITSLRGLDRKQ